MADLVVVDASVLYEVLTSGPHASVALDALAATEDFAAPELIDVEVVGLIRRPTPASTKTTAGRVDEGPSARLTVVLALDRSGGGPRTP